MSDLQSGQTTVTTAGTEVVLGTGIVDGLVQIKAKSTNTGLIYIGNDGSGAVSLTTGFILSPGDIATIRLHNLNEVWVDSSVNGEGVSWIKALTNEQ